MREMYHFAHTFYVFGAKQAISADYLTNMEIFVKIFIVGIDK